MRADIALPLWLQLFELLTRSGRVRLSRRQSLLLWHPLSWESPSVSPAHPAMQTALRPQSPREHITLG